MAKEPKQREKKEATVLISLIPILALVAMLIVMVVVLDQDVQMGLVGGCIVAAAIGVLALGYTWEELEKGILKTIDMGMQACIILMIIGILIGSWILSGIVPTLIFYGLKLINPAIFLAVAMVICSIVSLATGSSWTTAGTVGIALIGVAHGLGIPAPIAAGAIISGAYFGDKMSPLSDTTNLAPAMAGANLFDHVKHMVYTTGPSYVIAFVLYLVVGFKYKGSADIQLVTDILNVLESNFKITPILLIPPVLVILMVVFKVPAIPGLIGGVVLGGIFAMITQGYDYGTVLDVMENGFAMEVAENASAAEAMVGDLLNRGGMQSMMWTISLIICALSFGGIMEATGMLESIAKSLLKFAKNTGSLVLITIFSCVFINVIAADQYLAIVLPGRMFKDEFARRHLAPRNLSRTLEDGGTLTSPLVPWNTCGAFMASALQVETVAYLPYCFLNLINPIVAIVLAYLNLFQLEMTPEEIEEYEKSKLEMHAAA